MLKMFISACVRDVIQVLAPDGAAATKDTESIVDFVISQIHKMPPLIRFFFRLVSILAFFYILFFLVFSLGRSSLAKLLMRMQSARIGPLRDFSRLLLSLTALRLFSVAREKP
jgi:hypothetical protein